LAGLPLVILEDRGRGGHLRAVAGLRSQKSAKTGAVTAPKMSAFYLTLFLGDIGDFFVLMKTDIKNQK